MLITFPGNKGPGDGSRFPCCLSGFILYLITRLLRVLNPSSFPENWGREASPIFLPSGETRTSNRAPRRSLCIRSVGYEGGAKASEKFHYSPRCGLHAVLPARPMAAAYWPIENTIRRPSQSERWPATPFDLQIARVHLSPDSLYSELCSLGALVLHLSPLDKLLWEIESNVVCRTYRVAEVNCEGTCQPCGYVFFVRSRRMTMLQTEEKIACNIPNDT